MSRCDSYMTLTSRLSYSLLSLRPEVFDVEKSRDEDSEESSYGSHHKSSMSTIYLMDDEDSEFRIVDPAMQYLLAKKMDDADSAESQSLASAASSLSLDFNTYYGNDALRTCNHEHFFAFQV